MKKIVVFLIALSLVAIYCPAYSAPLGEKGASPSAYEHASDQSIFNRTTDWFATVGKSPEEKEKIKAERSAQRAAKRAEKEAKKAQKELEKKSKEAGKEVEKSQKKMKDKLKNFGK